MNKNPWYYLVVLVFSAILCGTLAMLYTIGIGNAPSAAQLAAMGFLSVVIIWISDNA
tara:strand:- start:168 stop:338 length:171 start_codon:yes stop_codon:yes gene_type:complete